MIAKNKSLDLSASPLGDMLLIVSSLCIIFIFVLVCVRAPLWYDEGNYLTLAGSIQNTGYPVWFWIPETPELFLTSPPAILYLIGFLPTSIFSNIVLLRIFFIVLFGLTPFTFLVIRTYRKNASPFAISVTALYAACSGVFLMELVQVRFDMPLACLSCLILAVYADVGDFKRGENRQKKLWLCFLSVFLLSVLAFLTKWQAVCVTGTLCCDIVLSYLLSKSRAIHWFAFFTHLTGVGFAIGIFIWWSSSSEYVSDLSALSTALHFNIFHRIFPSYDLIKEITVLVSVAKEILLKTIVPALVLLIACALRRIDWCEPLFRLFVLLTVMVVAFNLTVYRMPGAGSYYMVQAIIPLGYVLGRSIESLLEAFYRPLAAWVLVLLLILHGILNLPPVTRTFQPDPSQSIAEQIAPVLRSEDLIILGDQRLDRSILFWLHHFDRYGFLFSTDPGSAFFTDPDRAEQLLRRDGSARVDALVFIEDSVAQLKSEKWSVVSELIEQKFFRAPQVAGSKLVVFLRCSLAHPPENLPVNSVTFSTVSFADIVCTPHASQPTTQCGCSWKRCTSLNDEGVPHTGQSLGHDDGCR